MQSSDISRENNIDSIDSLDIKTERASENSTFGSQETGFPVNVGLPITPSVSNYELHGRFNQGRCGQITFCTIITLLFVASLVAAILLPVLLGWWGTKQPGELENTQVQTVCGIVEGVENDGVYEFRGIPYALPPIGKRRFKKPVELFHAPFCNELKPRNGILHTKTYKSPCLQYKMDYDQRSVIIGSEDCLYLNIYTPEVRSKFLRPVIVWISGFLFLYGSGNQPVFQVTPEVVKAVDSVHVTFNYRLGPFGFMVNPKTGESNFGLKDQLALLRWIRKNIAHFGGNKNNVILFGIGSGATSAMIHYTASSQLNLFHKVWMSSPALQVSKNVSTLRGEQPVKFNQTYRSILAHELMNWTWNRVETDILPQMFDLPFPSQNDDASPIGLPVIDNDIIKKDFWKQLKLGRNWQIPIVVGSTSNEALLFPIPGTVRLWQPEEYEYYIKIKLSCYNISWEDINEHYPLQNSSSIELHYTELVTDLRVTCPLESFVNEINTRESGLIYRYLLTDTHPGVDPFNLMFYSNGAMHGWDGILYFGGYQNLTHTSEGMIGENSMKTTHMLRKFMKEFAWEGTISQFRRWESDNKTTNVIYSGGVVKRNPNFKSAQCKMWSKLNKDDFLKYSWPF